MHQAPRAKSLRHWRIRQGGSFFARSGSSASATTFSRNLVPATGLSPVQSEAGMGSDSTTNPATLGRTIMSSL